MRAAGPPARPLARRDHEHASPRLYGARPWRQALADALRDGVERPVSGGEVGGRRFYCAAILGSPARWAGGGVAVGAVHRARAGAHAKLAMRRAFLTRLRFQLDGGPQRRTIALSFICPMISRTPGAGRALEAAVVDVRDAMEAFRLGLNNVLGDWRADPAVSVQSARSARVWAKNSIPALLDGEIQRVGRSTEVRFIPLAFRALALEPASL